MAKLTMYEACAIVEGFDGVEHSQEKVIGAWQYLIDTGLAWQLQGWYGRTAEDLIINGLCKPRQKQVMTRQRTLI